MGGKGPQRRPQRRLDKRLEGVAEAVAGGYCRLQMPLMPALAVRETVAGRWLGALEGGGKGGTSSPFQCIPDPPSLAHAFTLSRSSRTGPMISSAQEAVLVKLFRVMTTIINSNLEGVRPKDVLQKEGFSECLQHVMGHSEAYGTSGFCLGMHAACFPVKTAKSSLARGHMGGGGATGGAILRLSGPAGGNRRDHHWGPAARAPHHGLGSERRLMPYGSLMS